MNGTLNILLTNGTLYTKVIHPQDNLEFSTMHMLVNHKVDTTLVQSIWFQPSPIQITLEDLDLD
jgi:hypothetical protein